MAIREKIELLIDVTATGAKSSLRAFKDDIDDADGAFGKLKAGAKSAFDNLGGIIAGGLAAAGTALFAFGTKSVTAFQDVALESGKMADALGVSTEEASRLIEVAGDLGIETSTLESAIGRMNRTIATSPEKFDAIGAAIARNKDGTVDVVQTFKNAAEAIDRIPDAAVRAKAAQEIFGKGWQQIAELIAGGATGIREAMKSVEEGKVIDEGEVARARKFRDTMDELKGKFEEFAISAGGHIVRTINGLEKLGEKAETAFRWLTLADARQVIYDNVVEPIKAAGEAMDATFNQDASIAIDALKKTMSVVPVAPLIDKFTQLGIALRAAADAANTQTGPGLTDLGFTAEDLADALRDQADALNESIDAMWSSADASIAAQEAQEDFAEAAQNTVDVSKDSESTARDVAEAVDRERDAMRKAADAAVTLAEKQATANGTTLTAQQRVDTFNKSLLDNAQFATPAARDAIARYIVEANGIPESESTDIIAAIQAGDFARAQGLINDLSRTRDVAIVADAKTAQAEQDLAALTRTRNATINANIVARGGAGYGALSGARASGGPVNAGEAYVVGEKGKEVFVPNEDGTIIPNGEGYTPLTGGSRGGGVTNNITINMPPGSNGNDVVRAIKDYERRNGPGWRAS
jgi:methyl-accepting chemotaxis protein